MSDRRVGTLRAADPSEIEAAQKRYQHISMTIDDAVAKLQKIVDAGEEGLRGEWVGPLKKDAESLKGDLGKAAVRYRDVATEIRKYEPELQHAITEVAAATAAEDDGNASLTRANAMPDPQKGPDGVIPPEEEQKAAEKKRAQEEAASQTTAAKNRLVNALNDLDVAGKRLGDAVNCKNYDDGLTDKINWRVMAIFKKISEIFGIIAMVLTALAFLIPGLNVLAIAGAVAGAVTLIADSVLLGGGDGSVLSVVLGAVGLGFAGLGAAFGHIAKTVDGATKFFKGLPALRIRPGAIVNGRVTIELFDFSKPIAIAAKPGFFAAGKTWWNGLFGAGFKSGFVDLGKSLWAGLSGAATFKNVTFLSGLSFGSGFAQIATGFKAIFASWNFVSQFFNLGAGLIVAGLQATENPLLKDA
ncbi:hypothetical protein [Melissospora conviva]|uniref:hypothetical protein n=1 Tax=Melissospora conviva TaxID=3388432 RepID=UPI003C1E3DB2